MAVLGVWAARDPRGHAQRYLRGAAGGVVEGTNVAIAVRAGEPVVGQTVRIGHGPTASKMSATTDALILERGPAWTAPIYYRVDEPVAASNLAPLVRDGDALDLTRIAAMTGDALHRDESRSVYQNIRLVRPFETVVLSSNSRTSTLRPPPRLERIPNATVEELAEELRRRLRIAVERASGDRRVGLMLSGGMDSSSILAVLLLSRGASARDVNVTVDFDAAGSDRPHVRAIEKHYGISVLRIPPAMAPAKETLVMDAAPSRHHGDPWVVVCARKAHELGAELLLTGTGGDGLFGGHLGSAMQTGILQMDLAGTWDVLRARFPDSTSVRQRLRVAAVTFLRPHLPRTVRIQRAMRAVRKIPDWVGPVLREELRRAALEQGEWPAARDAQMRFEDTMRSPFESEYGAEARAQTDNISPIPRADPVYDEDLVQFLCGVRQQALFAGGTWRGLLRLAMRGLLPESVRNRMDKSDFEPALADSICPFERFEPLLSFESIGRAGIVEPAGFREYLAPLYAAPRAPESGSRWLSFWPALASEAFLRSS